MLYAILASRWFEFASPGRRHQRMPGDWVEVTYAEFSALLGTDSRGTIARWLRILCDNAHACPWGRCPEPHPLVVAKRASGARKSSRYRKWRCGEDIAALRRKVSSPALKAAARRRIHGDDKPQMPALDLEPLAQSTLTPKSHHETLKYDRRAESKSHSKTLTVVPKSQNETSSRRSKVSPSDFAKSHNRTLTPDPKSHHETAEYGTKKILANSAALEIDETDAVACELTGPIYQLGRRVEPSYGIETAKLAAKRIAISLLSLDPDAGRARAIVTRALADRRLEHADNPVGMLIRGLVGTPNGDDRFLLPVGSSAVFAKSALRQAAKVNPAHPQESDDLEDRVRRRFEALTVDERLAIESEVTGKPSGPTPNERLRPMILIKLRASLAIVEPPSDDHAEADRGPHRPLPEVLT